MMQLSILVDGADKSGAKSLVTSMSYGGLGGLTHTSNDAIVQRGDFSVIAYARDKRRGAGAPRGMSGIMLTIDLSQCQTREQLAKAVQEVQAYYQDEETALQVLVGTKSDAKGAPSQETITQWLQEIGCPLAYFHTSVKTGEGVMNAFNTLCDQVIARYTAAHPEAVPVEPDMAARKWSLFKTLYQEYSRSTRFTLFGNPAEYELVGTWANFADVERYAQRHPRSKAADILQTVNDRLMPPSEAKCSIQ